MIGSSNGEDYNEEVLDENNKLRRDNAFRNR